LNCGYDLTGLPIDHTCPECGEGYHVAAIRVISEAAIEDANHRIRFVWALACASVSVSAISLLQRSSICVSLAMMALAYLCVGALFRPWYREWGGMIALRMLGFGAVIGLAAMFPSILVWIAAGLLLFACWAWGGLPSFAKVSSAGLSEETWWNRRAWTLALLAAALVSLIVAWTT
jgi:hypothetical protein